MFVLAWGLVSPSCARKFDQGSEPRCVQCGSREHVYFEAFSQCEPSEILRSNGRNRCYLETSLYPIFGMSAAVFERSWRNRVPSISRSPNSVDLRRGPLQARDTWSESIPYSSQITRRLRFSIEASVLIITASKSRNGSVHNPQSFRIFTRESLRCTVCTSNLS